ncbi:MAG: hypothetical protein IJZ76_01410 [Lachnospiraceae bacterium]|nr:hypothetical protein [Lachnospiraceae bacterium]
MKVYNDCRELTHVICNRCEKQLNVQNGLLKDAVFEGEQSFGYFSKRDGIKHSFDLCEDCYEEWIRMFRIPVTETENTELL